MTTTMPPHRRSCGVAVVTLLWVAAAMSPAAGEAQDGSMAEVVKPTSAAQRPLAYGTNLPATWAIPVRALAAWETYRWRLLGAGLVAQSLLIALLLAERRRRRRAQDSLGERLRFETLLSELSTTLITVPVVDLNRETGHALRRIVEALGLDRATLAEVDDRPGRARIAQCWERPGIHPIPASVEIAAVPWMASRLSLGHVLRFSRLEELPDEASIDRQTLLAMGTRALALIPLAIDGAVVGALTFASRRERAWPPDLMHRLELLGEVFANALARRRAAGSVPESDPGRRRRAEDEPGRRREELAHALRVVTLGELSGSLAHEISQPLAAIMTNAQATLRLLARGQGQGEDVRAALADIADDSKRAAQVVGRLRILSRNVHGVRQALSINDLVDEVVAFLRGDFHRRGIGVVISLDSALPPIFGDPIQLQQVLLNLLINASEAVAAAGAGPGEIRVATARHETDLLEISISDAGAGVPEADLERIFEPFVSTKANGLGMGLSISRSIVEGHGGRIWATRNVERGLTVHVELLCEEGSEAA